MRRKVLFSEQSFGGSGVVGVIELARPEVLNALDAEMLQLIASRLKEWRDDPRVACIFIHSENPKAFCSGGDVKSLARTRLEGGEAASRIGAEHFFTQEYFADCLMHLLQKPVVAWLDGICMGGGMGLTQGASHRIVTERTVMAMPEVFIGFFPDVGATRYLSRLKNQIGIYLGLTGRRFSGATGYSLGLADYLLPSSAKRQVMADLLRIPWSIGQTESAEENKIMLSGYFSDHTQLGVNEFEQPDSEWRKVEKIFARGDFGEIIRALAVDGRRPSLLSQAVFYKAAAQNRDLEWPDVFTREWSLALRFSTQKGAAPAEHGEFAEGVRALLIDKDLARWPERSIEDAWAEADRFLEPFEPNLLREKLRSQLTNNS